EAALRQLPGGDQYAERDWKVETPALLRQVGGREVDDHLAVREIEAAGEERGAHPVAALAHGRGRQADQREARQAAADIGLDGHRQRLEAALRATEHLRQGHADSPLESAP